MTTTALTHDEIAHLISTGTIRMPEPTINQPKIDHSEYMKHWRMRKRQGKPARRWTRRPELRRYAYGSNEYKRAWDKIKAKETR